jgi:hypothetical protein
VGRRGDRINLAQGRYKWQAHVKMTMILQVPYNAENVLPIQEILGTRRLQRDGRLALIDAARK